MKKVLIISGMIIVLGGLAIAGYWYWQSQQEVVAPLQTVALDSPAIKSFDDVCTPKDEYELECKGNIEQFGCERYSSISTSFADLQPSYPMLVCEKKTSSIDEVQRDAGVYRQNTPTAKDYLAVDIIYYLIIKDGLFQFIASEQQFISIFQPIDSVVEATDYFQALHKSFLLLDEEQLVRIKSSEAYDGQQVGSFSVPLDSIGLSEITETWNGYAITAYSSLGGDCVTEVYRYKYLLKKDGRLVEKNKQLIWESDLKPRCIN